MKKNIILIIMMGVLVLTGCTKKTNVDTEKKLLSEEYASIFREEIKNNKDILDIADTISKSKSIEFEIEVAELDKEDYLMGFDADISGYKRVVQAAPIISTIPFVLYIFEVEEAEDFAETLKKEANPRWNICTEADEVLVEYEDNYVFMVMTPSGDNSNNEE